MLRILGGPCTKYVVCDVTGKDPHVQVFKNMWDAIHAYRARVRP